MQLVYRGQSHELDLSSGNAGQLDKARRPAEPLLEPYLAVARDLGPRLRGSPDGVGPYCSVTF